MKLFFSLVFVLIAAALVHLSCGAGAPSGPPQSGNGPWVLSWSDEFDAPDGSAPDPAKWALFVSGNGEGNHELEYYTDRPRNAYIQKGNLVIAALKETYTGLDGTRDYTSARLSTVGFQQVYGRIEARIKLPRGQGIWSAFWMLGNNMDQVGWPQCGEIDIMENIGHEPSTVHGTIHGPGYSGKAGISAPYALASGAFAGDYHVFAAEWEPGVVRFYVDGNLYSTVGPSALPPGKQWVLDGHPFQIILNVAVGGDWPGPPDETTVFPQTMLVDYVRVYKRAGL
jgi:beta-glucanase (GH16 family)